MVWTYQSGPNTVSSPVTLTLALTGLASGTFTLNPTTVGSNSAFSAVSGALPDGTWSVGFSAVIGGVTFVALTKTSVTTSTVTAPAVVTHPVAAATQNTIPVTFSLPDAPLANSVTLTFVNTSNSATTQLTLTNATTANFILNPANLAASSSVTTVVGSNTLPDGTYDVVVAYRDTNGHSVASTVENGWTLDTHTTPPTLPAPTGGANGSPLSVQFTLPEAPLAGSPTLTLTGPTTVTLRLAASTAGTASFTLDPSDPSASSGVVGVSPVGATLPAGTYTATLAYQDALGNAAATAQVSSVVVSAAPPAVAPVTSTSSPTPAPVVLTTSPTAALPPSNVFALARPAAASAASGAVTLAVRVPGAGTIALLGTHSRPADGPLAHSALGALEPGWDRLAYGRASTSSTAAGLLHLTLAPDTTGRALLARERRRGNPLHIRVWISFTPSGGTARTRPVTVEVLAGRAG
jgi:methionine-rich copper-binding protein CopC